MPHDEPTPVPAAESSPGGAPRSVVDDAEVLAYLKRRILVHLHTSPNPTKRQYDEWCEDAEQRFGPGAANLVVLFVTLSQSVAASTLANNPSNVHIYNRSVVVNSPTVTGELNVTNDARTGITASGWQGILAAVVAVALIISLMVRAFMPGVIGDQQFMIFRFFMALGAMGFAALVPGFLKVKFTLKTAAITAGGAAAAFVLVYLALPAMPGIGLPQNNAVVPAAQ